ncbi:hypothetical protein [Streptomyces niveus]|uniref:hypothetical protein n=1 Tax=Streptomyces niveus TaxID=193462 RepID=UPI00386D2544
MSIPVPHTGRKRYHHRYPKNGGLSGRLPGRYPDEGEKGAWYRRIIRRAESAMWRREALDDM